MRKSLDVDVIYARLCVNGNTGSRINSPTNADFLVVCGDQLIRERVVHKAMQEIYEAKRREI